MTAPCSELQNATDQPVAIALPNPPPKKKSAKKKVLLILVIVVVMSISIILANIWAVIPFTFTVKVQLRDEPLSASVSYWGCGLGLARSAHEQSTGHYQGEGWYTLLDTIRCRSREVLFMFEFDRHLNDRFVYTYETKDIPETIVFDLAENADLYHVEGGIYSLDGTTPNQVYSVRFVDTDGIEHRNEPNNMGTFRFPNVAGRHVEVGIDQLWRDTRQTVEIDQDQQLTLTADFVSVLQGDVRTSHYVMWDNISNVAITVSGVNFEATVYSASDGTYSLTVPVSSATPFTVTGSHPDYQTRSYEYVNRGDHTLNLMLYSK
ncbi:hypothetical protein GEMRC1_011255 [Eukaryota sp. GEM-RC1]